MKNTARVNVTQTNSMTGRTSVLFGQVTLANAVEIVRHQREDGDGSWTFAILTLDGRLVTRGDVRAAGL